MQAGAIALAVAIIAVLSPRLQQEPASTGLHVLVGVAAITAIIGGIRRHRPSRTLPWWLFGAGVGLFVTADLVISLLPASLAGGYLATVASFLGYVPLAGAAVALVRARLPGGDREGLIDAGIIATAAGLVVWELNVEVLRVEPRHAWIMVSLLVPVFALGVRLLFTGGERLPSLWLLIASGSCGLVGSGLTLTAGPSASSWSSILILTGYLLLGAAALHPSMRALSEPARAREQRLGSGRLMLLGAALLVGPAVALVRLTLDPSRLTAARPLATAVIGALVLWRLARVAAAQNAAARRGRVLAEASRTLSEIPLDYPPVLHAAAQLVSRLFDDPCAIWIIGPDGRFFEDRAVHHPDPEAARVLAEIVASVEPAVGEGFSGMVVARGSAALSALSHERIDELADSPYGPYLQRWGIAWVLGAPLRARGRILGVLLLARSDHRRPYTTDDREFVQELADRAAIAVDHALLYQAAEVRAAQQDAVSQLGHTALTDLELSTLLDQAVATVAKILNVEFAKVVELQPDGRHLLLRAGVGWREGLVGAATILGGRNSQAGYTLHSRSPVVVDDLATEERFDSPLLREHGVKSGVSVVIQGWDGPFGVLSAHSTRRRAFSRDDVNFLQAVANVLAGAIERDRTEKEIRHQALHDELTGLPNRTLLLDRLRHAITRRRRDDRQVAVLFIDLDNFKVVNDSYGHRAGDQLLVRLVQRLRRVLRPADTIARLSGDEFVAVCEDIEGRDAAVAIAERITAAFDEPFALDDAEVFASASIGIAVADSADSDAEALLRSADTAMYQAKRRGRARHELFDEEMRGRALRRLRLEHDLRGALHRQELRAVYQPLVTLPDNRIVGVETLLRWDHPELGAIPPDDFIPIAEESGSILALGVWVLRAACSQITRWHAELSLPHPFTVYVNLSGRQLADPALVETVADVLRETGANPAELGLEITETSLLEDAESALSRLDELKRLGVRLAMDDFGTGYSSLSYLRRMPLDVVKVDRSFVQGLGTEPADSAIVAAVVRMAGALHLNVTAEGVETPKQLLALQDLGCDLAQGFYFAHPVNAEAIHDLLVEHAA